MRLRAKKWKHESFPGRENSFNNNLENQATLDFLIQTVLQSCLIVQPSSRLSTAVARTLNWGFFHFLLVTKCTHWSKEIKQNLNISNEFPPGFRAVYFCSSLKLFRYSFSEAIPIFFNCFKSDFILVWSL